MTKGQLPRRTEFLTVQDVLELHESVVRLHGGAFGLRDAGLLDSAVHQPMASYGGQDLYRGLFDKVAALLFHLSSIHPFVDGNERTAWAAAATFLDMNGIALKPRHKAMVTFVESIAAGKERDVRVVSAALAKWATPRT